MVGIIVTIQQENRPLEIEQIVSNGTIIDLPFYMAWQNIFWSEITNIDFATHDMPILGYGFPEKNWWSQEIQTLHLRVIGKNEITLEYIVFGVYFVCNCIDFLKGALSILAFSPFMPAAVTQKIKISILNIYWIYMQG